MTTNEAKEQISKEFIDKYYTWLGDIKNLAEYDYSRKYGYGKPNTEMVDCIKSALLFQKYIFSGLYLPAWEKLGYDKKVIWELHRDGFLSCAEHTDWLSRQTGRTTFYYISQKLARQIYKDYHR